VLGRAKEEIIDYLPLSNANGIDDILVDEAEALIRLVETYGDEFELLLVGKCLSSALIRSSLEVLLLSGL
jgi:hypothetical protein